ncbi:MAG: HAD family phosphatase [Alistipes sp.]|nr:HAD family phosphatase [Alistipes sp.]
MLKGIIFDMDGVLVDNRDAHFEAFRLFCQKYVLDCPDDKLLPLFGKGNDEILPGILPRDFLEEHGIEKLSVEKEEIYRDIISKTIRPADGLVEFLDDIRSHGIKTAVGSSGPAVNVNFVLDKCGIADRFDAIANGDMVRPAYGPSKCGYAGDRRFVRRIRSGQRSGLKGGRDRNHISPGKIAGRQNRHAYFQLPGTGLSKCGRFMGIENIHVL